MVLAVARHVSASSSRSVMSAIFGGCGGGNEGLKCEDGVASQRRIQCLHGVDGLGMLVVVMVVMTHRGSGRGRRGTPNKVHRAKSGVCG